MKEKLAKIIHDWYSERWNNHYADLKEPGWAVSEDIAELLLALTPDIDPGTVKGKLALLI